MAPEIEFTRIDARLVEQAAEVIELAKIRRCSLATAESCTGGLAAAVLSDAPGAGDWLHGGFVVYTPVQKIAALGVDKALIEEEGLASEAVARAMAEGALARSPADVAVAVTGVAGPTPDEDGTPVGTMHVAAARRGGTTLHRAAQLGDLGRGACRYAAVELVLAMFKRALDEA